MSGSLKMFEIRVTNTRSKETLMFLGQGTTVADAVSDGVKCVQAVFQPKEGRISEPGNRRVVTADGRTILRTLAAFEEDDGPQAAAMEMEFA